MRIGKILLVAVLLCAAARPPAPAADFTEFAMPPGHSALLSIRSTRELLHGMDAAWTAVLKDNPVLDPGGVLAWARMNLPLLGEDDVDARIFLFGPPPVNLLSLFANVLIVENIPLDRMLQRIIDLGGGVTRPDEKKPFIHISFGQKFTPFFIYDLEDDAQLIGMSPGQLEPIAELMRSEKRPRHWGDGVVNVTLDKPGDRLPMQQLLKKLAERVDAAISPQSFPKSLAPFNRSVLANALAALEEEIPPLTAQLKAINRVGFDIQVDGERLGLAMRINADPDSWFGKAGAAATARQPAAPPFAEKVPDNVMQLAATAPFGEILHGFAQPLRKAFDRVATRAFPEKRESLLALFDAAVAAPDGGMLAFSTYAPAPAGFSRTFLFPSDRPLELLELAKRTNEEFSALLAILFPGIDEPAFFRTDGTAPDGQPFRTHRWNPRFAEKTWMLTLCFWNALFGGRGLSLDMPEPLTRQNDSMAAGKEFVVLSIGDDSEKKNEEILRPGPAASPFLKSESARETLTELKYRQNGYALMNYDFMIPFLLSDDFVATQPTARRKRFEAAREKLPELQSRLRRSGKLVGMAAGGVDGCLIFDFMLPTAVVNAAYHNFSLLSASDPIAASRIRTNEASAIASLKTFAMAQVVFQVGKMGRQAENTGAGEKGFADNYRNLYYSLKDNQPISLISRKMADAFAGPSNGVPVVTHGERPGDEPVPFNGYLFLEPPGLDHGKEFCLIAYPEKYGMTGERILAIDQNGVILEMLPDKREGGLPKEGDIPALVREDERPGMKSDLWKPL